jgi:thymidylate synthase
MRRPGTCPAFAPHDLGKKAYGNPVELARLQEHVAGELGAEPGRLIVHATSAHIYEPEWELMARIAVLAAEVSV